MCTLILLHVELAITTTDLQFVMLFLIFSRAHVRRYTDMTHIHIYLWITKRERDKSTAKYLLAYLALVSVK